MDSGMDKIKIRILMNGLWTQEIAIYHSFNTRSRDPFDAYNCSNNVKNEYVGGETCGENMNG